MVDLAEARRPPQRFAAAADAAADPGVAVAPLDPAWARRYAAFAARHPHGTAQRPGWLAAWADHAAPDIVTLTCGLPGSHPDAPWLLLPLEVVRRGPFTLARFIGGTHANANFPAFDAAMAPPEAARLRSALKRAFRIARPDVDLLQLERLEPRSAGGAANPLLVLGGSLSPNPALSLSLDGGFEAVLKRSGDRRKAKKHRSHARRFEEAGGFRLVQASDESEVTRLLDAFFEFKRVRFARSGITDVFAEAQVRAAIAALFRRALPEADPSFVLQGLEVGGVVRAVTGSSRSGDRVICEFGAIREDDLSRYSPGEYLFHENIRLACAQNRGTYDFGVGDERYKRLWCGLETNHVDLRLPLSAKGRVLHALLGCAGHAKRVVKRNPALWRHVKALRQKLGGRPVPDADEAAEA